MHPTEATIDPVRVRPVQRWRSLAIVLAACCLATASLPAPAADVVFTVGGDPACDFRTGVLSDALQQAVDAVPPSTPASDRYLLRVARTGDYTGTVLAIENRALVLEGGYATCGSTAADGSTTLDAGGADAAAVRVRNTDARRQVTLSRLRLTGAQGPHAHGLLVVDADVTLSQVVVDGNTGALRGAGVHVENLGLGARLALAQGSRIEANAADQEGGGIYCGRGAELWLHANTGVTNNTAAFHGGGIYVNGCSGFINLGGVADGGYVGGLRGNAAHSGAGIYLTSTLAATDIAFGAGLRAGEAGPVIADNDALVLGGGLMAVHPDTRVLLNDARVSGNSAGSIGGGIQVRSGAQVTMQGSRRGCAGECSALSFNVAGNGGALSVGGSGSRLVVRRTLITGNTAADDGAALYSQSEGGYALLENVLVASNSGASVVFASDPFAIATDKQTVTDIVASTFADNVSSTVLHFNTEGVGYIGHSIVHAAAGTPAVAYDGDNEPVTFCSVFHEAAGLATPGPDVAFSADPGFVDAVGGDYRLRPDALAVDRCAVVEGVPSTDLAREVRPYDMPAADVSGPVDAGAFEANETIHRDGFEP